MKLGVNKEQLVENKSEKTIRTVKFMVQMVG